MNIQRLHTPLPTYYPTLICALSPPCACYSAASRPPLELACEPDPDHESSLPPARTRAPPLSVNAMPRPRPRSAARLPSWTTFLPDPYLTLLHLRRGWTQTFRAHRSRNLPQPKFRNTLRETLAQGNSYVRFVACSRVSCPRWPHASRSSVGNSRSISVPNEALPNQALGAYILLVGRARTTAAVSAPPSSTLSVQCEGAEANLAA